MKNRLNKDLIGDLQSTTLSKEIIKDYNFVDLNYLGCKNTDVNNLNFILENKEDFDNKTTSANVNRALFWLSSKRGDYVREDKGGVLYDFLGKTNTEEDLRNFEEILRDKFNEQFSGDMLVHKIVLTSNKFERSLHISMIVQDLLSNKILKIETGVKK